MSSGHLYLFEFQMFSAHEVVFQLAHNPWPLIDTCKVKAFIFFSLPLLFFSQPSMSGLPLQYRMKPECEKIKRFIEQCIQDAQEAGSKVIALGLLNKVLIHG
jgi:hypothetical protein